MPKPKTDGGENTLTTRELRGDLSEAIMRAHFGKEHIIVTHHGRKYAALIPFEELEKLEKSQTADETQDNQEVQSDAS